MVRHYFRRPQSIKMRPNSHTDYFGRLRVKLIENGTEYIGKQGKHDTAVGGRMGGIA